MKHVLTLTALLLTLAAAAQEEKVEFFYQNGQIKERCLYKNGYKNGLWQEWEENGSLAKETQYRNDTIQHSRLYNQGRLTYESDFTIHPVYGFYKNYNWKGVAWKESIGQKGSDYVRDPGLEHLFGYLIARTDEGFLHYFIYQAGAVADYALLLPRYYWNQQGKVVHVSLNGIVFQWHADGSLAETGGPFGPGGTQIWLRWNDKGQRVDNGYQPIVNDTLRFDAAVSHIKIEDAYDNQLPHGQWNVYFANGKKWFSQEFDHGVPVGRFLSWHYNGEPQTVCAFKNGFPDGLCTAYHANGQKRAEGTFVNGLKHGSWKCWNENGQLMADENYVMDQPHGLFRRWTKEGVLLCEKNYENGRLEGWQRDYHYATGKLVSEKLARNNYTNGWVREYYPNQQLKSERYYGAGLQMSCYENGQPQAISAHSHENSRFRLEFNSNGSLRQMVYNWNNQEYTTWENTGQGPQLSYNKSGHKSPYSPLPFFNQVPAQPFVMEGKTVDGKKDGTWTVYYPNRKKWMEIPFRNGQLHGTYRIWTITGSLLEEMHFENDLRHGAFVYYDEKGKKLEALHYKNDLQEGVHEKWNEQTGRLSFHTEYRNGLLHGRNTHYRSDGSPSSEYHYADGKKNGAAKQYDYSKNYLLWETTYTNDLREGPITVYAPEGWIKTKGFYARDKMHGTWTDFDTQGKITGTRTYRYGQLEVKPIENVACQCTENYLSAGASSFFGSVSELTPYNSFVKALSPLLGISPRVYDRLFYRNYRFDFNNSGSERWDGMDLMAYDTLWISLRQLPGLRFVANPCLRPGFVSHTPVSIGTSHPIRQYYLGDDTLNETALSYFDLALEVYGTDDAGLLNGLVLLLSEENEEKTDAARGEVLNWLRQNGLIKKDLGFNDMEALAEEVADSEPYEHFGEMFCKKWLDAGPVNKKTNPAGYALFEQRLRTVLQKNDDYFSLAALEHLYKKTFSVTVDISRLSIDFPRWMLLQWDSLHHERVSVNRGFLPARLTFGVKGVEMRNEKILLHQPHSFCFTPAYMGETGLILHIHEATIIPDSASQLQFSVPGAPAGLQPFLDAAPGVWTSQATGSCLYNNKNLPLEYETLHITGTFLSGSFTMDAADLERINVNQVFSKRFSFFQVEKTGSNRVRCWFLLEQKQKP